MARENSPKERQRRELERKRARRGSYDRILIVSEGSKTEPNYFLEIRSHFRLHSANVQVRPGELGTAPIQVVKYAKDLFETGDASRQIQKRAFERVYVLFDRDDHDSYFEALRLASSLDGKLRNDNQEPVAFKAIASVPCFELWLLLHFEDVLAPIGRDEANWRLKKHMPLYAKGADDVFRATRELIRLAIARASALSRINTAHSPPEPYTDVASLVELLLRLKN